MTGSLAIPTVAVIPRDNPVQPRIISANPGAGKAAKILIRK